MFLNFILIIFTICFGTIPYGITGQFSPPQPDPPDTDILKQSYTELLHNLVKLNNERMGIAKPLNDIESYDPYPQGLSSQIHVESFNDDDDLRYPTIYLLESPRYNTREREELDTIPKKITMTAARNTITATPRPATSSTASSDPPPMNDAAPTFTRREANILRAAWNASCTKKAIRKCKKACKKALKKPCRVMRCRSTLRKQFKNSCSTQCESKFV